MRTSSIKPLKKYVEEYEEADPMLTHDVLLPIFWAVPLHVLFNTPFMYKETLPTEEEYCPAI